MLAFNRVVESVFGWAALSINSGRRGAYGRTPWVNSVGFAPRKRLQAVDRDQAKSQCEKAKWPRDVDKCMNGSGLGSAAWGETSLVSDVDGDARESRCFHRLHMSEAFDEEIFWRIRRISWKTCARGGESGH